MNSLPDKYNKRKVAFFFLLSTVLSQYFNQHQQDYDHMLGEAQYLQLENKKGLSTSLHKYNP